MKQAVTLLIAGAMLLTLAGCGDPNSEPPKGETPPVTVTESTDPVTLASEQVDRTEWTGAFSDADNYGVKSVITVEETENGQTMSEVITISYLFDGDKVKMDLTLQEDGKTSYISEGYLEFTQDEVTVWQRAKEDTEWIEWDSENYSKSEFAEMFGVSDGLEFVKDKYANFSYNNTEKGYLATTSGLTAMQESIETFLMNWLSQADSDADGLDISKFVVKVNGGKPSACIAELASKAPAPEARDMLPMDENGGASPDGSETSPDGGNDSNPDGETGPTTVKIKLTQVYFDYGKVNVTKPTDIPAAPETEERSIKLLLN